MAAEGERCEGDEGLGQWRPNAMRVGNRHVVSVPDSWCAGFDEHRSGAGFESLLASPTGTSPIAG